MSLIHNKFATRDYETIDTFRAGVELFGFEVKSLRNKQGSLKGAYVTIRDGQAFLLKAFIPPFQPDNAPTTYDPERERRLLLTKKEIRELDRKLTTAGLTLIPVSLYNKGSRIKLEVVLARGKKKHDKREDIKKKDQQRDLERVVKTSVRL